MKQFWNKHKPLWISLLIALSAGIVTAFLVGCAVLPAAKAQSIRTEAQVIAEAEQKEAAAPGESEPLTEPTVAPPLTEQATDAPLAGPTPVPISEAERAQYVAQTVENLEMRRSQSIPVALQVGTYLRHWEQQELIFRTDTGKEVRSDYAAEWTAKANAYAEALFGQTLPDPVVEHSLPQAHYDRVVRVRGGKLIVTMEEATGALLNADCDAVYDFAEYESKPTGAQRRQIEEAVFAALGKTRAVTSARLSAIPAEDGTVVGIGWAFGSLYSVSVYPDMACAADMVYFPADVKTQSAYVEPVGAADFVETTAETLNRKQGNLESGRVERMARRFYEMAMGEPFEGDVTITAMQDRSGAREDFWIVKVGDAFTMEIAAQSGHVMRWNGVLGVTYDGKTLKPNTGSMSESDADAYLGFVRSIAPWFENLTRGEKVETVDWNAEYDSVNATLDICLSDGTIYELYFQSGKLREIWYYYSEDAFLDGRGGAWEADDRYRNTVSGAEFTSPIGILD